MLESESRLNAAMATAARLNAEVNDTALTFPAELDDDVELVKQETALYQSRRESTEKGWRVYAGERISCSVNWH